MAAATAVPDPAVAAVSEAAVVAPIGASRASEIAGVLQAPEWPSGLGSLLSVPKAVAPVELPVFSAVARVADQINSTVNVFLHRVGNWLAGLPGNSITTFLEGALLLVRRTLFNQAPNVTPVQEVTTSELIRGSLGAVDPDADTLSYAVVTAPEFGEVVVDEYGDYVYTPGADYAGSDSFVVRVASGAAGANLFGLGGDGSTVVTVLVGQGAATNPFMGAAPDPIDATLCLADTAATVTVARQGGIGGLLGQFAASVTLDAVTAETSVLFMDSEGRTGEVSAGQILAEAGPASWWDEFAAAAKLSNNGVRLGVDFTDADGVRYTLILSQVVTGVDAAGRYVLRGMLAPNPEEQDDIDQWDLLGSAYKDSYENFLATYVGGNQPLTLAVAGADVFLDTYSPVTFANQLVGADLGVSAQELGIGTPQSAASGISQGNYFSEQDLRAAVQWAFDGKSPLESGAPLFSRQEFKPRCGGSCDGSFYPFVLTSDSPYQLASKSFNLGAAGQTLNLSYDVKHAVYGYAYVPSGVWDKLFKSEYAGGFLLALPTGPSVTVNLAGSTTFSSGNVSLLSREYYEPTPYGVVSLGADVSARLDVTLDLPADFSKGALKAYAYFVPGLLVTYNTGASDGLQFGFGWYKDIDFSDFGAIQGVSIVPTITPSVTGSYGLFFPQTAPLIGGQTIASMTLGYENPVSLDLALPKGANPSLTLNSNGTLNYGAGILQALTDSLSFSDNLPIYSYTSPNLL